MQRYHTSILKTVWAAFFLALSYVLPFLTGQIPAVGAMLCPMHRPILLCGFLCGWQWGLVVGLSAPLLRSLSLGMPVLFPMAICMALELAAYGAISGLMHRLLPKKRWLTYASLLTAMVVGRLIWGGAMLICMNIKGQGFGLAAFLSGAVTGSIPGIVLQILVVPPLVVFIEKISRMKE